MEDNGCGFLLMGPQWGFVLTGRRTCKQVLKRSLVSYIYGWIHFASLDAFHIMQQHLFVKACKPAAL